MNQLRLLSLANKAEDLEALAQYRSAFWRVAVPVIALFLLGVGGLGYVAWRGIGSSMAHETQLRTALMENEERLFQEKERRDLAATAAKVGYWEWKPGSSAITYSDNLGPLFGLPRGASHASMDEYSAAIHPDDRAEVMRRIDEALAGSDLFAMDYRVCWPDGSVHWLGDHGRVHRDAAGRPDRMLGVVMDIGERKHAEQVLREREAELARFKSALDQTLDCVFMFRPDDFRFVYVNEGARRQVGYSETELFGMTPLHIKPEFTRERFRELVRPLVDGHDRVHVFETVHRHKDGHDVPVEIQLQFVRLTGGEARFVAIVRDISERRRAERALRESEARYRRAERGVNDGLWDWNVVTGEDYFSPRWLGMLGYQPGELPYRQETFADLIHPDDRASVWAAVDRHLQAGESFDVEFRLRCKDGRHLWVRSRGEAERDAAGKPVRMAGSITDITERKLAEAELRTSEARLNEAQRIARLGSWEINHATGLLHWSDEVYRLFEINPAREEDNHAAFQRILHPDDRDAVNAAFTASLRDRRAYRITHRLLMPDGRVKHVEEQCETDFAPDGTPLQSRGTVQDVTERVLAERALQASLQEKTMLFQEVHHRVKNNLQIVSSLLFFEQRRATDPAVAAQFQRSHRRVAAISLVHERLYQTPDLAGISFASYVESLGQHILREFPGQAGPVALRVEGPGFQLSVTEAVPCALIVNELLTNSLKHAFPAGRGGTVTIRLETDAAGARHLWFGDDGTGLPADAPPAGGRSFGLRLVGQLTEQLQATLVREPAAQGLRFHLTIPPAKTAL